MEILADFAKAAFVVFTGLSACVGLLALASPHAIAVVASYGNRVLCQGAATRADKRWFDFDKFALEHSRLFGSIVISAVGYVWLISHFGPDAYPKSFLMVIVAIALVMGIVALCHIVRQSRQIESQLAVANTDPLTGLANRRAFDVELARRLAQRQRQGTPLCLAIIDIDRFKLFNDEYGHLLGDAVLKHIAKVLEETVRYMDIVARLGGDEFAVLYPSTEIEEASHGAERLRAAINSKPLCSGGQEHSPTISIGLAEALSDDDANTLIKRSDSALYAAKEAGRNCSYRHGSPEPATSMSCGG